jgi:hypothetical protein
MFASNFTVTDKHLKWIRGKDNLTTFSESKTLPSGHIMTNYFCSTCGSLMNRVGSEFPGYNFLRIGTVDDFHLHETKLKPDVEQFVECRVGWLKSIEGVNQVVGIST